MPAYRWLFETREIQGQPSADAVKLEGADAPPAGYEVVPTSEGKALGGVSAFAEKELSFAGSS